MFSKFVPVKVVGSASKLLRLSPKVTPSAGKVTVTQDGYDISIRSATPPEIRTAVSTALNRAQQARSEGDPSDFAMTYDSSRVSLSSPHSPSDMLLLNAKPKLPPLAETLVSQIALNRYEYKRLKSPDPKTEEKIEVAVTGSEFDTQAVSHGNAIAESVIAARNLGNLRHDEGTPTALFEWVKGNLLSLPRVHLRHVFSGGELAVHDFNLLYSVGKGAVNEPRVLVLEYVGAPSTEKSTAIVGKGVTFDTGGLNVKPTGSMESMHLDKMGAVAALCTLHAVASLELPVNVTVAVGFVENAIGPTAYHPSSIIRSMKGLTVEVLNTDAEGRLVLADLLTFVQTRAKLDKKVDTVIDMATLTGAAILALGEGRAALFGNDKALVDDLTAGGAGVNELMWPMPIGFEHKKAMKGKMSDLVNYDGKKKAAACTAAAFLHNFIETGTKWAHIDIAGPGMGSRETGAPGWGIQTLVNYFRK